MKPITRIITLPAILILPCFSFAQQYEQNGVNINENFQIDEYNNHQVAKDFSGHRIGLGFTHAGYIDDTAFVFDYGYEFNRYIGFMLSASQYDDNVSEEIDGTPITLRLDGVYTRVGVDVGYTFDLEKVDIKPYAVAGILYLNESNSLNSNSDIAFQYGVGLRATLSNGIYMDASYRMAEVDNWAGQQETRDGQESILTIGYKF